MKPKFYEILLMAIQDGVEAGWHKAHKHNDDPDAKTIKYKMTEAVLNSLHEWFHIPGDYDD